MYAGDPCRRNSLALEVMSADKIRPTIPAQMSGGGQVEGMQTNLNDVQWQLIVAGNNANSTVQRGSTTVQAHVCARIIKAVGT